MESMDLNHLHLHARDLAASQRFYETYFGFKEHVRHGEILFLRNRHGFDLALVPDSAPPRFPDWFHFGFRMGDGEEVRALHSRMLAEGIRMAKPLYEDHEIVSFRCLDPDGYGIEVYWE